MTGGSTAPLSRQSESISGATVPMVSSSSGAWHLQRRKGHQAAMLTVAER